MSEIIDRTMKTSTPNPKCKECRGNGLKNGVEDYKGKPGSDEKFPGTCTTCFPKPHEKEE